MESLTCLAKPTKPWVLRMRHKLPGSSVPEGVLLIQLDGRRMTTLPSLFDEFASAFRLPDYFGRNYNALDDCLTDLDWLPARGYILEVDHADALLESEPSEALDGLLEILEYVGQQWATPVSSGEIWDRDAVPFHTVLVSTKFSDVVRKDRVDSR